MFNQKDEVNIKVINTYSKGFEFIKDETNSPLIIDLPAEVENIDFPKNLLVLEIYEIHKGNQNFKQLIYRIFIGDTYTIEEMNKINPSFKFSSGMNWSDLCGLKPETHCVFYKKANGYVLLAKLKDKDIVVSNIDELKSLLSEMSMSFTQVQVGMSRIRNIKQKNK